MISQVLNPPLPLSSFIFGATEYHSLRYPFAFPLLSLNRLEVS